MNLDVADWKEFRFGDLISDIYKAKAINKDDLTITTDSDNAIRYITRTGENNGCELLADIRDIDSKTIEKGNAISIGDTTATCFYQDEDFITGDHMVVVRADSWLNSYTALYIVAILTNEQYKYSYGRAYLMDRIKDTIVKLPTDSDGNPDWQFIEDYMKSLHHKPLTTKNKSGQVPDLNVQDWGEFKIKDFFNVELAKGDIKLEEVDKGEIPLVSSGESNNGIVGYIDKNGDGKSEMFPANCITIDMFGNAFYQNEPFYAVSHGRVNILTPKFELTKNIGLFISTIIKKEQYKFSYGRAVYSSEAENINIVLPVDVNGNPDWQFMEDYIKALPYGDRLEG